MKLTQVIAVTALVSLGLATGVVQAQTTNKIYSLSLTGTVKQQNTNVVTVGSNTVDVLVIKSQTFTSATLIDLALGLDPKTAPAVKATVKLGAYSPDNSHVVHVVVVDTVTSNVTEFATFDMTDLLKAQIKLRGESVTVSKEGPVMMNFEAVGLFASGEVVLYLAEVENPTSENFVSLSGSGFGTIQSTDGNGAVISRATLTVQPRVIGTIVTQ